MDGHSLKPRCFTGNPYYMPGRKEKRYRFFLSFRFMDSINKIWVSPFLRC